MTKAITLLAAGLLTSAVFILVSTPAAAASIDINIGVPTVIEQARPVYVHPQYESDWRERQARAAAWRASQASQPSTVTHVTHTHVVQEKAKNKKHPHKHDGKHPGKGHGKH